MSQQIWFKLYFDVEFVLLWKLFQKIVLSKTKNKSDKSALSQSPCELKIYSIMNVAAIIIQVSS